MLVEDRLKTHRAKRMAIRGLGPGVAVRGCFARFVPAQNLISHNIFIFPQGKSVHASAAGQGIAAQPLCFDPTGVGELIFAAAARAAFAELGSVFDTSSAFSYGQVGRANT